MACTPLTIQTGLFITLDPWVTAASTTFDGKTVTRTTSGPNPGISVQQGGNSDFFPLLTNHTQNYKVLGNRYLLILDVENAGGGSSTRTVTLLNFATWTPVNILTVTASPITTALPVVNASLGDGSVFLAYGQDGTQSTLR